MADVHLIWFTVDDSAVTASRADVRAWADELGLPQGPLSRGSMVSAFLKACSARVTYQDEAGQDRIVSAHEVARKDEFITFNVVRDDGMVLAQLKFFNARHNRAGIVTGTHVVKTIVRRGLAPLEEKATRQWLAESDEKYTQEQGYVPWPIIRRLARLAILAGAVPVTRRDTTFFGYDDDLRKVRNARTFMLRAMPSAQFVILPIEDGADLSVFAGSADDHLFVQANELLTLVGDYVENPGRHHKLNTVLAKWVPTFTEINQQMARHERRLSTVSYVYAMDRSSSGWMG